MPVMMTLNRMDETISDALNELKSGRIILLHDSSSRENETDMVAFAGSCSPETISCMRETAGGLICAAIGNEVAANLGLPYMHDILEVASSRYSGLLSMIERRTPYGGRPAFSISVNHRNSFTGISDIERSETIRELGRIAGIVKSGADASDAFYSSFRSPGHVPILIEARESLSERRGHTELSIRLAKLAGLPPATVVCEMLDGRTHRPLTAGEARKIARAESLSFVEGELIR